MASAPPPKPHAHVSLITLGVGDVARAARFYAALGFTRKLTGAGEDVAFFEAGGIALSLFRADLLAEDAGLVPSSKQPSFRGVALAWNCNSPADVDAVMAAAAAAGGDTLKPAQQTFWGGYAGYFTDLDGHLWEVAHNPRFPLSPAGTPHLPD